MSIQKGLKRDEKGFSFTKALKFRAPRSIPSIRFELVAVTGLETVNTWSSRARKARSTSSSRPLTLQRRFRNAGDAST